MLLKKNS